VLGGHSMTSSARARIEVWSYRALHALIAQHKC
jgi:hypothetical protein